MTTESAATKPGAQEQATLAAIDRFNEAFNRQDVDGVMAAMTEDCLFDDTVPPDGAEYRGQAAVRGYWQQFFAGSPNARFETEEQFVAGDHCIARWRYAWRDAAGVEGHVRGVDIFLVRDGKVAEKRAYVKG